MLFHKISLNQVTTILILSAIIFLAVFLKLAPYLKYDYYYLIGFDSGKYVYDLRTGSSTSLENLDLWSEPGLSTNLAFLNSLVNIDPINVYKYLLPIYISIFFVIVVYLFAREISKSSLAGIFASLYLAVSTIFLNSTFDSYYRQIFGTIIYMMFLFYSYKTYRDSKINWSHVFLLGLLGAGVVISHRAITLLLLITLFLLAILYLAKRQINNLTKVVLIGITSLVFSSVYWLTIINQNLIVFKEAIVLSLGRKSGGNSTIRQLTRNQDQLLGYLTSIPISFLPFIAIFYITLKKRIHLLTAFTIIFIAYILFRIIFFNRFLFNLEILFAIIVGIYFYSLLKVLNRRILISITGLIVIFGILFSLNLSISRRPYLADKTPGIIWIEKNIARENSIFFAPDALATILTQIGFDTSLYKYPITLGSGMDPIKETEVVLTKNCQDPSILKGKFDKSKNIYIIFDMWNINNPLPKTREKIPLEELDKCLYYEKIFEGDSYIQRIFKLKKEYQ